MLRVCGAVAILLAHHTAGALGQDDPVAEAQKLGAVRLVGGVKSSFSPDGKELAYGAFPFGAGVRVLNLQTKQSRKLTDSGKDPSWASGGSKEIAYVQRNGLDEEVWLVGPDGETRRKVADGGYPTWSKDGKTLYYQSRRQNALFSIQPGTEGAVAKKFYDVPSFWYPAVSPNGKWIAVQKSTRSFGLINVQSGETTLRTYPDRRSRRGFLPAWSPNSRLVAFGSYGNMERAGLWVLDTETGGLAQIFGGDFTMPVWSADGKRFAFDLRGDIRQQQVWMIETSKVPLLQQDRP